MAKVPQKYPDLFKVRLAVNNKDIVDAVVIHKNISRYAVAYDFFGRKEISHLTENRLTELIEKAQIMDSPLYQAMEENHET